MAQRGQLALALTVLEGQERAAAEELWARVGAARARAMLAALAAELIALAESAGDRRVMVVDVPTAAVSEAVRAIGKAGRG